MTNAQRIRMALAYIRMSEAELARKLGSTPQAFHQRLRTDKFASEELDIIAQTLGAVHITVFEFPDGTKI